MARSQAWQNINQTMQAQASSQPATVADSGQAVRRLDVPERPVELFRSKTDVAASGGRDSGFGWPDPEFSPPRGNSCSGPPC